MVGVPSPTVASAQRGAPALRLVPEALLPEQLVGIFDGGAELLPEKALRLAVLSAAVFDYQRFCDAQTLQGRREFAQAAAWFEHDDPAWPYSFQNICDALGLDDIWLRRGLRAYRARVLATPSAERRRSRRAFRHTVGIRTHARGRAAGLHDGRRRAGGVPHLFGPRAAAASAVAAALSAPGTTPRGS